MDKPNLLVVVVDDLGWSDIGYNNPTFPTPTIDALAKEGILLGSFYTASTCTPSRSQLMTGRYNYRIGMQDSVLHSTEPRGVPLKEEFLSSKLGNLGYRTAALGKWHLGMHQPQYTPLRRGFDLHYGILTGGGDHSHHVSVSQLFSPHNTSDVLVPETSLTSGLKGKQGATDTTTATSVSAPSEFTFQGYNLWEEGEPSQDNYKDMHSTDLYTEKAVNYMKQLSQEGSEDPWFIYLAYQALHDPIDTSPKWYTGNSCESIAEPEGGGQAGVDWKNRVILCGMMAQIDHGVSQLEDELMSSGQWDNTVLVFMSDNGGVMKHGSLNTPFRGEKGMSWEGGVRVPAFISGGYTTNALKNSMLNPYTFDSMVHITDLHATLVGLAGGRSQEPQETLNNYNEISFVPAVDGLDQWEAWTSTKEPVRDSMVLHLNSRLFAGSGAVRIGDFKLMRNPDPKEATVFSQVRQHLRKTVGLLTDASLYSTAKNVISSLGLDNPDNLLFDIRQNPFEVTDGLCVEKGESRAACTNLYDDPEYAEVRADLESFFYKEAASMAPSSFRWSDDGPLANPSLFGGVWSPWRDAEGVPKAQYCPASKESATPIGSKMGTSSYTLEQLQGSLNSGSVSFVMMSGLVSGLTVLLAAVAGLSYRAGRRSKYKPIL